MNQQPQDHFAAYENMQSYAPPSTNTRSPPSSTRGYNQHALLRQSSRHFENFDTTASYHSHFPGSQRNDPGRYDGMSGPLLPQYPHDSNAWSQIGNGMQQVHNNNNMHGLGSQMGMNMGSTTLGSSSRRPPNNRRTPLPSQPWLSEAQQLNPFEPRSAPVQTYNSSPHNQPNERAEPEEDLIPTAIVIKNIPFAVKKEQLTEIMSKNSLPLPYAFNYHFDSGVFRGLAFANFSTPEETQHVIEVMNHMEISGRKLRVEYKRMLPMQERERIEREKRERRGQLEEQHRPTAQSNGMLHSQPSLPSLTPTLTPNITTSPSPVSTRATVSTDEILPNEELDMNDKAVLNFYTQLIIFIGDPNRETMIFPTTISPTGRRIIHTIAHQKRLEHRSTGQGDHRQVMVSKVKEISPPLPPMPLTYDYGRRGLNRAATTDFGSVARADNRDYHTLERQGSHLFDIPPSPSNGFGGRQNLREAKSFADLRSHSGSPSLLSANIPPLPGLSRYDASGMSNGRSSTPTLTPTSSSNDNTMGRHDGLLNAMSSLSVYPNDRSGTNRSNGRLNMDRDNHTTTTGAIGGHRQTNGNYEDRSGGSLVERQPRIPNYSDSSFSRGRQNGLGGRADSEFDRISTTRGCDDNRS